MKRILLISLICLFAFSVSAQSKKTWGLIKVETTPLTMASYDRTDFNVYDVTAGLKFEKVTYGGWVRNTNLGLVYSRFEKESSLGLNLNMVWGGYSGTLRGGVSTSAGYTFGQDIPFIEGGIIAEWRIIKQAISINTGLFINYGGARYSSYDKFNDLSEEWVSLKLGLTYNF